MTIQLNPIMTNDQLEELKNGHFFVFNDFTQKHLYYDAVKQVILAGIEKFEGIECRQAVERNGLSAMHKYFPADKLIYLDVFVRKQTCNLMIEMAYSFCKNDLNFLSEFFIVPDDFLFKISYPFEIAIKSKATYDNYVKYCEQYLKQPKPFHIKQFLRKVKAEAKKLLKKPKYEVGYHEKYPYAANAYGPHLDSWYGSGLDGINLWWSIEGAREDNSMLLYPESFGKYIKYKKEFLYLPPGISLPKPHKVEIPDGSILVFNSDLLHGSRLNLSNVTRIVIAPRVTLHKPRFNPDSLKLEFDAWYSSEDIGRGDFEKPIKFPMTENWGVLYEGRQKPYIEKRLSITVNSSLSDGLPIALCPSETLSIGEKILVNLKKESVIVFRTVKGLQAVSAICPHLDINLIDGFHDEQHIYCPGHGVAFNLIDGSSKCHLLRLRVYKVYDHEDKVFIEKAVNPLEIHSCDNKTIQAVCSDV